MNRRALLAGAAAGIACGLAPLRADEFAPSAASLARPAAPPRDLSGLKIEDGLGRPVALSHYLGSTLVVNFWAPWCAPCRREMPSLARLAERLEDTRIKVITIGFDKRGPKGVMRFFEEAGVDTLPIFLGDADNFAATLGDDVLPTTLVIGDDGVERAVVVGAATWDDNPTLAWLAGIARG